MRIVERRDMRASERAARRESMRRYLAPMQTIDGDFIATARLRHADGAATPRGWRALGPDGATVHAEAIAPGEADVVRPDP